MRESGAAFGCLAELATRRGSPLRPVPLQEVPSSTSSLPRRLDVPAESCQPPSSRPTRTSGSSPTVHTAAALRCGRRCCTSTPPSCSRSRYRRRRLRWMPPPPQGWRYPRIPSRRAMRRARLQQRARLVRRGACPRTAPPPTRSTCYSQPWRRLRQLCPLGPQGRPPPLQERQQLLFCMR